MIDEKLSTDFSSLFKPSTNSNYLGIDSFLFIRSFISYYTLILLLDPCRNVMTSIEWNVNGTICFSAFLGKENLENLVNFDSGHFGEWKN